MKHYDDRGDKWCLNSIKLERRQKIMRFCRSFMLSYVECMIKFEHDTNILSRWCLPIESFPKKIQREEEDEFRFVRVMIEKIEFDF